MRKHAGRREYFPSRICAFLPCKRYRLPYENSLASSAEPPCVSMRVDAKTSLAEPAPSSQIAASPTPANDILYPLPYGTDRKTARQRHVESLPFVISSLETISVCVLKHPAVPTR